jgi:hypothetical protein
VLIVLIENLVAKGVSCEAVLPAYGGSVDVIGSESLFPAID